MMAKYRPPDSCRPGEKMTHLISFIQMLMCTCLKSTTSYHEFYCGVMNALTGNTLELSFPVIRRRDSHNNKEMSTGYEHNSRKTNKC